MDGFDPAAARVRNQVIERLLKMNAKHATHAWFHRRAQPVGPHGLAFLYLDPAVTGETGAPTVVAATRLVDQAGDLRDLPRLLYRLANLARERYVDPVAGFDPRVCMANRQDPMSPGAFYIGLGISSLDSDAGTWEEAQRAAHGPLDLPGRCYALLTDGTQLRVERGGPEVFGEVRVTSTQDLNVERGISIRPWVWRPDLTATSPEVWHRLADLHALALSPYSTVVSQGVHHG